MHCGGHLDSYHINVQVRIASRVNIGRKLGYTDSQIQKLICKELQIIREELLKWHWWIGDYFDPCTLYPSQIWTTRFLVVPEIVNNDK